VVVEGQSNTLPVSSTAPPAVHSVAFGHGVAVANTTGGTVLVVSGVNFGPFDEYIAVGVVVPSGTLATNCTLLTADTVIQCSLPAGSGVLQRVVVSVMGQNVEHTPSGLAFAAPSVGNVAPVAWPTDPAGQSVSLYGRGFGVAGQVSSVRVSLSATYGCVDGDVGEVTVLATAVTVRSDGELTFVVPAIPLRHLVPSWTVTVSVSGQATVVTVPTLPPSSPALTFDTTPNATHYFLTLTGANFGPNVGLGCPGDVEVAVGGQPCAQLSMLKVGGFFWWPAVRCSS
jgi:hypothetical protein